MGHCPIIGSGSFGAVYEIDRLGTNYELYAVKAAAFQPPEETDSTVFALLYPLSSAEDLTETIFAYSYCH